MTTHALPASPLRGRLARPLRDGIFKFFERRAIRNRTYRELGALSDRELNDIGLSRYMISQIAEEAARS